MFLPVLLPIEHDEYFPAWLSNLAVANNMSMSTFMEYCGNVHVSPSCTPLQALFPRNIDCFSRNNGFPDPIDILKKHTNYYVILPTLQSSRQAGLLARVMYDDNTYMIKETYTKRYKYCPICVKEDIKKCNRAIAHTPHQLADACWLHGVKLVTDPYCAPVIESASTEDVSYAKFVKDLYYRPVFTDLLQILSVHTAKPFSRALYFTKYVPDLQILKALSGIYITADSFRETFPGKDPIYSARCPICGKSYLQHQWIRQCPFCWQKKPLEDRIHERIPDYFDVIKKENTFQMLHKNCGKNQRKDIRSIIWNDNRCIACEKYNFEFWNDKLSSSDYKVVKVFKREQSLILHLEHIGYGHIIERNSKTISMKQPIVCEICKRESIRLKRIGMTKKNKKGETMTIVEFIDPTDINVLVGNRLIEHVSYIEFCDGSLYSNPLLGRMKGNYIGQRFYNKRYNQWMMITNYITYDNVEVIFEDGYIASNKKLDSIRAGICLRDDDLVFRSKAKIGEKVYSKTNHMWMELVAYYSANDVTVRFEDGKEVYHQRYGSFKLGMIKYPDMSNPKIGMTNTNNEGYQMTIVAYRKYNDIDIQFADGTTLEHRKYYDFILGRIKYPKCLQYVGRTYTATNGMKIKIIAYRKYKDVDLEFEDGTRVYGKEMDRVKKGKIGYPKNNKN